MKNIIAIIFIVTIGLISVGCSLNDPESKSNAELTIYTTIYPIQYAVERIGGETVSVTSIYPPGVDAHTYEPTSKAITSIARSDAFIYLGAGMEGFAESAAGALASQDTKLVEIGKNKELFHKEVKHEADTHGDYDPHIWLDPLRMVEISSLIRDELINLNPERADLYKSNFNNLKNDLVSLDKNFHDVLQVKQNKRILVSHAAFGYWEERYGLEQIAINDPSSSSEPSQKELTQIIEAAKNFHLEYIIYEQNGSNRVSDIIKDAIGAEALTIHNLAVLTDNDVKNNQDYLSLMKDNLKVLDTATK